MVLTVPIATCFIRAEIVLMGCGEPALTNLIRGVMIDCPGNDGLQLLVGLIGAVTGVIPWLAGGEICARRRGCVIAEYTGPHVKWGAGIVKDSTAVQRLVETVASRCRMGPHPVVSRLLVRLNNDHITLAYADTQGSRVVWRDWYQIVFNDGHGMVVNTKNKMCASRPVDQSQDVLLLGRKCCLKVGSIARRGVMAVPIDDNAVSPGETARIRSDLLLIAHKR